MPADVPIFPMASTQVGEERPPMRDAGEARHTPAGGGLAGVPCQRGSAAGRGSLSMSPCGGICAAGISGKHTARGGSWERRFCRRGRPARIFIPDYAQSSACTLGPMETRAQAPRKFVIPAKAGIHFNQRFLDSRFRGNDGLKETIYLIFVRNQVFISGGSAPVWAGRPRQQTHRSQDARVGRTRRSRGRS